MTLADLKNSIFRRTHTDVNSFTPADMVLDLNSANEKVHSRIRKYLDNFHPTAWTTTDLTTGTATPKFDANFHDIISLYVSYNRAVEMAQPNAQSFLLDITRLEKEIDEWYGRRNYEIFTVTIAAPGVITKQDHYLQTGEQVTFVTTGALPTGIVADTLYFVLNVDRDTFQVSATRNGTAITTTGTQSGTHYYASDTPKRIIGVHRSSR